MIIIINIADAALVALMGWDDKREIDSSGYILLPAPLWPDSSPRSSAYQRKRQTNRVLTMQT
ncbi:uncharacterized protein BO88DRAFT_146266 [Aspergillus vadensis CBS 113365]|uniref:Uncharacterized protein n=1 Tax=Aspergillus vadensis (strain CBS 113365 / IMI 142717 / IBT 24658) TaxID=1448311 RepID=A0A319BHI0_ASPVC|nr:hypothetical protein BO88DRAFT_146266 [Aspergillus vadensis CBS 113365]PYH65253.1 hypothetical protein BO88DRAFT_146266 [Aspergillus vadensis CBS 113365]